MTNVYILLLGDPHTNAGLPVHIRMITLEYSAFEPRPKLMWELREMIYYDDGDPKDFRNTDQINDFVKRARN
jgi:hypothetical protein